MILQVDILAQIQEYGGIVSTLLAGALLIVWREYLKEKKSNADLNATMREDAIASLKIVESLVQEYRTHNEITERMQAMIGELHSMALKKAGDKN